MHSLVNVGQSALSTGRPARRHGTAHPTIVPYQTFAASDGPFVLAVGNDEQWRRLCTALGEPERGTDPESARNPDRVLHRAQVVDWLAARFATESRAHWMALFESARVPAGAVRDVHEVVTDPALAARGMVADVTLADGAATQVWRLPWSIAGGRPPVDRPPPALGQHTAEFLERFGDAAGQPAS